MLYHAFSSGLEVISWGPPGTTCARATAASPVLGRAVPVRGFTARSVAPEVDVGQYAKVSLTLPSPLLERIRGRVGTRGVSPAPRAMDSARDGHRLSPYASRWHHPSLVVRRDEHAGQRDLCTPVLIERFQW
jgi:hypothetical protein